VPGGINLGQGVFDLDTPAPLREGAIASIDGGDRPIYTPYAGLPQLRAAIAKKLQRHNGLPYEAANTAVCTGVGWVTPSAPCTCCGRVCTTGSTNC